MAVFVVAACGATAEQPPTGSATTTAVAERTVSVPLAPGADWRLSIRDGVLIATPPGLGIGPASPGGRAGLREVAVGSDDGSQTGRLLRISHGAARDTLRDLTAKARTVGAVRLGSRTATELAFPGGERSLALQLDDMTVLELVGTRGAPDDDRMLAVLALAAPMRDSGATYRHDDVAAALDAAVGLTRPRVPDPPMSQGSTVSFTIGAGDRDFAMVMTFADRRARLQEDPNEGGGFGATVSWIAPIAYRGLGNAAVVIGSADAAVRYRALRALDGLASRGSEPACVEDPRAVFHSLLGALGVSSFGRFQERLTSDGQVSIADARGILGNAVGLRGRVMSRYFEAATRTPLIGSTALRPADVLLSGTRLGTPTGTRATSRNGELDLAVTTQAGCERGLVRFFDLSITVGTPAAHPCPELQRQGLMTKGIPVSTATASEVLRLLKSDAGAIHTLEDIAGVRQDPNPLRDPRVPRCAVAQLSYGQPVFARRHPSIAGYWFVPVRFGDDTVLTVRVSRDENGLGLVAGGSQGGDFLRIGEAEARRRMASPGDPIRSIELVYAKPRGRGPDDQLAWRAVRSSGAVAYLFPSYPGTPDGLILSESEVTFPPR